jgi:lactoylglutathione lyase
VELKTLIPNVMVEDVNGTIEFYRDVLGFRVNATVPAEGQFDWASMRYDAVELMFQSRSSLSEEIPAFKDQQIGGALTFSVQMQGLQALYDRLKGNVIIVQDLHTTFYGMREFAVQDCNGFVLTFAEAVRIPRQWRAG